MSRSVKKREKREKREKLKNENRSVQRHSNVSESGVSRDCGIKNVTCDW